MHVYIYVSPCCKVYLCAFFIYLFECIIYIYCVCVYIEYTYLKHIFLHCDIIFTQVETDTVQHIAHTVHLFLTSSFSLASH